MKPQENSGSARTQTEQSHWAAHASEGQVWLGRPAGSSRVVWGLISCLQSVQLPWSKVEHPRPCIPLPSLLAQCRGSGELRRESGSFGLQPTTASPSGLPPPRHLPPAELPQVNPHRPPQWSSWVCPASVCWRASQIRPAAAPGTQPNAVRALPSSPQAPWSRRRLCWLHTALGRDGHSGLTCPCHPHIPSGMGPSTQLWRAKGGHPPVSRTAKSRVRRPEPHGCGQLPGASSQRREQTRGSPSGRADPRLHTVVSATHQTRQAGDMVLTRDTPGAVMQGKGGGGGHLVGESECSWTEHEEAPPADTAGQDPPKSDGRCLGHVRGFPRTPSWSASLV